MNRRAAAGMRQSKAYELIVALIQWFLGATVVATIIAVAMDIGWFSWFIYWPAWVLAAGGFLLNALMIVWGSRDKES